MRIQSVLSFSWKRTPEIKKPLNIKNMSTIKSPFHIQSKYHGVFSASDPRRDISDFLTVVSNIAADVMTWAKMTHIRPIAQTPSRTGSPFFCDGMSSLVKMIVPERPWSLSYHYFCYVFSNSFNMLLLVMHNVVSQIPCDVFFRDYRFNRLVFCCQNRKWPIYNSAR